MTGSLQHHVRAAGTCYQQGQQRCAAMRRGAASQEDTTMQQVFAGMAGTGRPVAFSVWIKKTGAGNQN
jgi:hypothetical protein